MTFIGGFTVIPEYFWKIQRFVQCPLLEVSLNDRIESLNSCASPDDTIGDLKKLVAAQTGTRADKIVLKKWLVLALVHIACLVYLVYMCYGKGVQKSVLCREVFPFSEGPLSEVPLYNENCLCLIRYTIFKDHITLEDCILWCYRRYAIVAIVVVAVLDNNTV